MISDDENNQAVTNEAFNLLHDIAAKRLALRKIAVVDAANLQPEARKPLVELARRYLLVPVAIVFNLPEKLCQEDRPHNNLGGVCGLEMMYFDVGVPVKWSETPLPPTKAEIVKLLAVAPGYGVEITVLGQ